jgi:hypothetical protein
MATAKGVPQTNLPKTGTEPSYTLLLTHDTPAGHVGYAGWRAGEPLFFWRRGKVKSELFVTAEHARLAAWRNWRGEGGTKAPVLPARVQIAARAERDAADRFQRLSIASRYGNRKVADRFGAVHGAAIRRAILDRTQAEEREVRRVIGHCQTYPGKPRLDGYGAHRHSLACICNGSVVCGQ